MKQLVTNYRYWLCALIGGAGLIGIVAEPTATTVQLWLTTMALSKVVGVALCATAGVLFRHYVKAGKIDIMDLIREEE